MTQPDAFTGTAWEGYDQTQDPTANNWSRGNGAYDLCETPQHNIEGRHFAAVRAPGWHKLGVVFDRPATAEELLVAAGADYPVFKRPLFAAVEDNDASIGTTRVSGKVAICRPGQVSGVQVLGIGSPSYQVVTNREAFVEFGDQIMDVAEPLAATCGVLYDGKRAFMCWRLPRSIVVERCEDQHELWLLVCHSHDQSQPLTVAITPLRTVCSNTERWNLGKALSKWTVKKTANANIRLQEVRTSLKLSYEYADTFEQELNRLARIPLNTQAFEQIIAHEFGPGPDAGKVAETKWNAKRDILVDLFATAETQANIRGTALAGIEAVGEYCDWMTPARATAGFTDADGYRFWRALDEEKSVTRPKEAMRKAVLAYAASR
jgi:phage/plasmid-like protein (TIGR03299 family)